VNNVGVAYPAHVVACHVLQEEINHILLQKQRLGDEMD
jgi:hypothetical protein